MLFFVLPARDEVLEMHTLVRFFGVDARLARELDLDAFEHGEVG